MKLSETNARKVYEDFLEKKLSLGTDYSTITSVIPTYNRCPYFDVKRNPLYHTVRCLEIQDYPKNKQEIIIVDDSSNDFTSDTVKSLKRKFENITYVIHEKRYGSGYSKNDGANFARGELINFVDDDMFPLTTDYLKSFLKAYQIVNELFEEKVGAIVGYTFQRRSSPRGVSKKDEMANIDWRGVHSNFDFFPDESELFDDFFLPLMNERTNLCGNMIVPKKAFFASEGFPDLGGNQYWEETIFALRLKNKGYQSFMNLDPRSSVLHLRWGTPEDELKFSVDYNHIKLPFRKKELDQLMGNSYLPRYDTGNRCSTEQWTFYKLQNYGYVLKELPFQIAFLNGLIFYTKTLKDFVFLNKFSPYERDNVNFKRRVENYLKALTLSLRSWFS